MASPPPESNQHGARWYSLPREIRIMIMENLRQDGCSLARLATVSREWQADLEPHTFARIRLTPSRLEDFSSMIQRNRDLVGYIWFCLELDVYDCPQCKSWWKGPFAYGSQHINDCAEMREAYRVINTVRGPITKAFQDLFSTLSTWDAHGRLTLDISVCSPSDSEHWFKELTFMPDTPAEEPDSDAGPKSDSGSESDGGLESDGDPDSGEVVVDKAYHKPNHGWVAGSRQNSPPWNAIQRVFWTIWDDVDRKPFRSDEAERQWWHQLPSVPVVTSLLLRQQTRRMWRPFTLSQMLGRFPRLEELHYEPWVSQRYDQTGIDRDYRRFFKSIQRSNSSLKRIVVFENFQENYLGYLSYFRGFQGLNGSPRAVGRTMAIASPNLEHLAASFVVDASHFFKIKPSWEWPNLVTLVLTSVSLTPVQGSEGAIEIEAMLQAAAATAMKMPCLETMEIWNGRRGLAALFRYQADRRTKEAVITWRATWGLTMGPSTVQSWEAIAREQGGLSLSWVQDWLDEDVIKSHGDAVHYLKLSSQVLRPVSLRQIRREHQILEGARTSY